MNKSQVEAIKDGLSNEAGVRAVTILGGDMGDHRTYTSKSIVRKIREWFTRHDILVNRLWRTHTSEFGKYGDGLLFLLGIDRASKTCLPVLILKKVDGILIPDPLTSLALFAHSEHMDETDLNFVVRANSSSIECPGVWDFYEKVAEDLEADFNMLKRYNLIRMINDNTEEEYRELLETLKLINENPEKWISECFSGSSTKYVLEAEISNQNDEED